MIDGGKRNVLGVLVDAVDMEAAVARILKSAVRREAYGVTALAVHGVMTGVVDAEQRFRINELDLVTPDGQPVRWMLNRLHGTRLPERVYGPKLMLEVCNRAARKGLPVYFYGSQADVLDRLVANLGRLFPQLEVAGVEPSKFGRTNSAGKRDIVRRILESGAAITFVGLGCPRQEAFAYEYKDALSMPTVALGAAFDYNAGILSEPPEVIQRAGLQWAGRLVQEPRRLWRRYLLHNSAFVLLALLQLARVWRPSTAGRPPSRDLLFA